MGASRPMTPAPIVLPGLRVTGYATATAVPVGMSRDRKTLYGVPNPGTSTAMYQSTDDGATWTSVHTFAEPFIGVLETDDGEALACTKNVLGTPGYLYKSSGWSTSHTTATWTKVLTTIGGNIVPVWSMHNATFGNDLIAPGTSKIGVLNEYGNQTTGVADETKGIHVYVTNDYGATWTMVLDIQTRYGVTFAQLHVHGAAYDPWWDRMWVTYGDQPADGTDHAQIIYSDDHGATWTALGLTAEWSGFFQFQNTAILPTEDAIIMTSDNFPGITFIPRDGYRVTGGIQTQNVLWGGNTGGLIATGLHQTRNVPNAPILAAYQTAASKYPAALNMSIDGGKTFTEIWRDTSLTGNSSVSNVYGPTYNGKIAAYVNNTANSTKYLLRGELVVPDSDLYDGLVTFTGDGATTVFTVAHGLSAKPNQLIWWPTSVAAVGTTVTVTSDATNLTFTFSAAPASAAILDFAYRVGL